MAADNSVADPRRRKPAMTESLRETRVLDAVVSLVDSLLDDFDVVELLTDLTDRCMHLLDIAAAGLLLADPRRRLHLMAATSEQSREVELFQLQSDEGPCLDCYASGVAISVADLDAEQQRWPQFVPAATNAGFVSVHAVPMRAAGTVLGALGLFGTRAGDLNDADLLVAQSLAHIASVAILQENSLTPGSVLPKLQTALTNRIVVEQAKGYLREYFDVSTEDAFGLLRRYARISNIHLTDVSRRLISGPAGRQATLDALADNMFPR
jgi:transcriptional regulator with GAF, ATPase, and Fis domain